MKTEDIEKRISKLEEDREKAIANVNALEGAIQDCYYWLEKLKEEEGPSSSIHSVKSETKGE